MARLQGRRIEALSERTADSSTFVEADGSMSTEAYAGPVRVKQADGSWKDIDTDLVDAGADFKPAQAAADVAVSGGGDTDLASVTDGSKSFGLQWSGMLPPPQVDGNTATYAMGGGALLTVRALAQGFEQSVVLASAPVAPVSYRIPLTLKGLSLTKDPGTGQLLLKDPAGKLVVEAAAPHMWDSSLNPASGEPAHQAEVATSIDTGTDGSTTLVLTPDPGFFAQGLTYPVMIDPSSTLAVTTDTWVQTPDYPDTQLSSEELKSGTYDTGTDVARSYLKFDVSKFGGKHITGATMSLYSYYSATCATTGAPTQARRITSALDTTSITWGTQPSTTTTNMASNTGHWGFDSSCPANWSNWTLTGMVQDWANGAANDGIQVRSADETDPTTWRRFRSANYTTAGFAPKLVVNYNSIPSQATLVALVNGAATNDTTPTLQAKATDADGGQLTLHFEVWNSAGTTMISNGDAPPVSQGSTASWTAPALAQGSYKWRALARDGTDSSATWPAWNTFTVDTAPPAVTAVASSDFPAGAWSGAPDANNQFSGSFTFTPPASDVASVVSKLDDTALPTQATTGAPVTQTLSFGQGKHTLYATSHDKAGNISALTSYVFYAGSGASLNSPGAGDRPARRVSLTASSDPAKGYTGVTYQYRFGAADPTWKPVPTADVTVTTTGAAVAAWPLAAPAGVPPGLTWNITTSLPDGPVDVRAVFTDGTTSGNSLPSTVTVDRNAGQAPTVDAGPASVNALTGDATLSATDASAFDMTVTRTASSRRPANGAAQAGQAAIFGPQWTAGTTAEITGSDWSYIHPTPPTSTTSVALVDVDGDPTGFTVKNAAAGTWTPEPGSEDLTLTGAIGGSTLTLTDTDGTTTTFTKPAGGTTWQVSTTKLATDNSTTTVVPDPVAAAGQSRPKYVIAPTSAVAASACQTSPATRGCRVLEYVYAATTTATATAFGNIAGQVQQIREWSTAPGASASTGTTVEQYLYDNAGQLRQAWDPRISPSLKTVYTYDSAGRIATQADPGQLPWTFTYDRVGSAATAGDGMLVTASRPTLTPGSASVTDGGTATTSIVYNVPLTGSGAPNSMAPTDVAAWGQADAPADATAVIPPAVSGETTPASHDGTALTAADYLQATVTYTDGSGREVNTATPGGHITTTEYDRYGNTVRELTAANRELALSTTGTGLAELQQLGIDGLSTADRAQALSTTSVFNTSSVAADAGTDKDTDPATTGQRELEEYGPLHTVTLAGILHAAAGGTDLPAGSVVPARRHTITAYDQGRPTDGTATTNNQATTVTTGADVFQTGSDDAYPSNADQRVSTTGYDWVKGLPTQTVTDLAGLNLVKTTSYDSQGRVIKTTLPKSNGTDAGATVTTYWSATGTGACNGRPEWADLVCSTGPAGAITGGGSNPTQLPTTTTEYDAWGNTAHVTKVANGTTLTTTTTYDGAGRVITVAVTGGTGTAVPDTNTTYDPANGQVATTTAGGHTITQAYDVLGRQISYNDGAGNTATTWYDARDRPTKTTDSAPSTTTYTYDTTTDPRGLETSRTDSIAGTFTATYDPDGNLAAETLPGGYTLATTTDETGADTSRTYTRTSDGLTVAEDTAGDTVNDQQATHASDTGEQAYAYDAAGRLTSVDDAQSDATTHRAYAFDNNTNRTGLTTTTDNPDGTAGTPATTTYTYDSADRLTITGTVYDAFGRTTTQATGATIGYYTNDLVHQQTSAGGTSRQTWTLDAAQRLASWTTETNTTGTWTQTGTKTNHYGSDTDSPDWTAEDTAGTITREVQGPDGDLDATTTATGGTILQLTDLHGEVSVQLPLDSSQAPVALAYDEFGNPESGTFAARYGWLGGKQRSSETITGATLMGVRLYDPTTGRFLSTDPIPGGNANAYDYCTADPINCLDLTGKGSWVLRKTFKLNKKTAIAVAKRLIKGGGVAAVLQDIAGVVLPGWAVHALYYLGVSAAGLGAAILAHVGKKGIKVRIGIYKPYRWIPWAYFRIQFTKLK
ncbi:DNRLRE domain-containing protein [Actinacidiphila sp. ITFR-21]|uniref:DNRLRE domain-containing protein n=1 Tax=Actinacidiphila sp. ITFR-21 TaxID=3075199 RepID=UPI002889834E|nr:DNRLRE domain-containing protein [Streptomyces sp. ITFR-21]WNI14092.1 DNRLRE domain-containing protein [Streptomyces sp. ITFR-21]